jgi:hypothetical protein
MSGVDFMTIARWAGHKDGGARLYSLHSQEPESMNRVEIYENAEGKLTSVALCNNGDRFIYRR